MYVVYEHETTNDIKRYVYGQDTDGRLRVLSKAPGVIFLAYKEKEARALATQLEEQEAKANKKEPHLKFEYGVELTTKLNYK